MKKIIYRLSVVLLLLQYMVVTHAQPFVHPGILHSKADLERIRYAVNVKQEPVYAGYKVFIKDPASQCTYKTQGPLQMVGRNPTVGQAAYDNDANAAHQNAMMWSITSDKRYADKAIEIVNAWSSTLQSITGRDAVLMAGLGPFKMVNAAEILRYTNAGWKEVDIHQAEKHFREVIYSVLKDFAPFANGNWDAAAIKTMMAIAVFCNDRPMFERALHYYMNGHGNGSLDHYIINEEGQVQESGRDQAHTQLGIGMLAECCAIAWNQGLNLYAYHNNRLLKGFEYVAKFNLGNDVPFMEWLDRTGKYHHTVISQKERGNLRAVYEQVYNHYVNVMGLSAPYVQQAAEKLRPEGPGKPGADHPGYGTLYFTQPKEKVAPHVKMPVLPAASGLPAPWKQQDIGRMKQKGHTAFDGKVFTVEGAGTGADSLADEMHFTYQPLNNDGMITLRFVPQPNSQFSKMGITMREGLAADAPQVSFLIYPGKTAQIEAPDWHVRLTARNATGERPQVKYAGLALTEPAVTFGRLTGCYWLRLQREGNVFKAYSSYDGNTWTETGSVVVPLAKKVLMGLSVASGIPNTTTVFFDHVQVAKNK